MPSAAEQVIDGLQVRAVQLLRYSASERRRIRSLLAALEQELVDRLMRSNLGGTLTAVQRRRLDRLLDFVADSIGEAYSRIRSGQSTSLAALAAIEARAAAGLIHRAMNVEQLLDIPTAQQLRAIAGNALINGAPSRDWWRRQSSGLRSRFTDTMRQGLGLGETNAQLVQRVRGRRSTGFRDGIMRVARADAFALVQSSAMAVANEARMGLYAENEQVVKGFQYLATLDNRTTQQCIALNGLTWDNERKPVGHQKRFQQPPIHWNCLPGDALVLPRGRVSAASKRWIDADIIVIRAANGFEIAGTPNHPVLTRRGWLPLQSLQLGDDIAADPRGHREGCSIGDDEGRHSRIGELAESRLASGAMLTAPMPVSAPDFHGDGADSEIAVVGTDRLLRHEGEARSPQMPFEAALAIGAAPATISLQALSALGPFGMTASSAARGDIGGARETLALLRADALHARELLLMAIARCAPALLEPPDDGVRGASHSVGNPADTDAIVKELADFGGIEFYPVASKHSQSFVGFVYNIETESGWYGANGIITHNCRSTLAPWLKSWQEMGLAGKEFSPGTKASLDGQIPAPVTFDAWLRGKSATFQNNLLGAGKARLWRGHRISLRDLIDQSGRPLTLAELEAAI